MANLEESTKNPTKLSVSARLESLKSHKKRPQAALLAENLASIEKALSEGISRNDVWESLREEGFTLTFKSFLLSLHRLRKKNPVQQGKVPQRPEAPKLPAANPQTVTLGALLPTSPPKPEPNITEQKSKVEEEEDKAYDEYKKSISHLSPTQKGKKLADFLEKQAENRLSPTARKLFGES